MDNLIHQTKSSYAGETEQKNRETLLKEWAWGCFTYTTTSQETSDLPMCVTSVVLGSGTVVEKPNVPHPPEN